MAIWTTCRSPAHAQFSQWSSPFMSGTQRTAVMCNQTSSPRVQFPLILLTIFVSSVLRNLKHPAWFSGFRSVSFTLHTNDVLSTVTNVLKSCSLPMEHIKGLKASAEISKSPEAGVPFYRPIKWDKSYYTFTGFRDPEQELQQARRVEPTLRLVTLDLSSVSQLTIGASVRNQSLSHLTPFNLNTFCSICEPIWESVRERALPPEWLASLINQTSF